MQSSIVSPAEKVVSERMPANMPARPDEIPRQVHACFLYCVYWMVFVVHLCILVAGTCFVLLIMAFTFYKLFQLFELVFAFF